ncbi:MAG: hypothetical protein ACON3Z_02510 [Bradymonadia bacterium]
MRVLVLIIAVVGSIGCGADSGSVAVDSGVFGDAGTDSDGGVVIIERPVALFEVADTRRESQFGSIPFPSDVYRDEMGRVSIDGFPHQVSGSIVENLIKHIRDYTDGFGTTSTMYLPVDGPLTEAALPQAPAESLTAESTLQLVDIDPSSAEYGRRFPINWRVQNAESLYLPPHTLKVRLVEGLTLRPKTKYALVLTDKIAQPDGTLRQLLSEEQPDGRLDDLWTLYAPLRAWAMESGITPATAAVFTTQDPVTELFELRDFLHEQPVPIARNLESLGRRLDLFELFVGEYSAPRLQSGELPYLEAGSGAIRRDADGTPTIGGMEDIRFAVTIPTDGVMPPDGWPVVLYGHGTGGDYTSFVDAKVAVTLARAGVAVVSIDQIHHGFRDQRDNGCSASVNPTECVSLLFFNFLVPTAGRDNVRQSALDFVSLLRLVRDFNRQAEDGLIRTVRGEMKQSADAPDGGINDGGAEEELDAGQNDAQLDASVADAGLPGTADAQTPGSGADAEATADAGDPADSGNEMPDDFERLRLDGSRVVYMGHSQGGLNGPLFLAAEPDIKGGVLSAAGALLAISLEQKTRPININELIEALVPTADVGVLDRWHPVLAVLQQFIEPGDPANYAPFWFHEPLPGTAPRHIFMTAGLDDEYTPPESIFALAAAGRVPVIEPVIEPIELFDVYGVEPAGIPPYSGNVAGGEASAGLVQIRDMGHFAIQQSVTLRNRYRRFVESIFLGMPSIF